MDTDIHRIYKRKMSEGPSKSMSSLKNLWSNQQLWKKKILTGWSACFLKLISTRSFPKIWSSQAAVIRYLDTNSSSAWEWDQNENDSAVKSKHHNPGN